MAASAGEEHEDTACWRSLQSLFDEPRLVPPDNQVFTLSVAGTVLTVHQRFDLQCQGIATTPGVPESNTEQHSQTGSVLWDSAVCVAKFLEKNADRLRVRGSRCVELGAGTGLPGLSLAALGAAQVTLTDRAEQLPILRTQVDRNLKALAGLPGSACDIHVKELLWGSTVQANEIGLAEDGGHRHDDGQREQSSPRPFGPCDVLVASDCIYDEALVVPLMETVRDLLGEAPDLSVALVAYDSSIGREGAYRLFEKTASQWFSCEVVPPEWRPSGEHDKSAVCMFLLRKA